MIQTAIDQVKWHCSGGHKVLFQSALEVRNERDADMEEGSTTLGVVNKVMKREIPVAIIDTYVSTQFAGAEEVEPRFR